MVELMIKDWFVDKMDLAGGFLVDVNGIEKETEKAYLLNLTVGYSSDIERNISRWCPKSCVLTKKEYFVERDREDEERQKRFEAGKEKHDKAYQFAKDNGLNVRVNFRTETIMKKIAEAGLSFAF